MTTRLRYLYRAYRYRYRVDRAELQFVCEQLQAGQVAVDIGCHKGAYTYWMRRQVGPSGSVFAFEPQPRQVAYLREAFSAMRYDNVAIVPVAVSDAEGDMTLHLAGSTHAATLETRSREQGAGSGAKTERSVVVPVTTLDAFFASRSQQPHFVKIDVEGHELNVLRGARRVLETHRPTLLVECEARHRTDGDVRPVLDFLAALGYLGSFFCGGERRPISEFNPAVHQRVDPQSKELPRDYVNNFAFEAAR